MIDRKSNLFLLNIPKNTQLVFFVDEHRRDIPIRLLFILPNGGHDCFQIKILFLDLDMRQYLPANGGNPIRIVLRDHPAAHGDRIRSHHTERHRRPVRDGVPAHRFIGVTKRMGKIQQDTLAAVKFVRFDKFLLKFE